MPELYETSDLILVDACCADEPTYYLCRIGGHPWVTVFPKSQWILMAGMLYRRTKYPDVVRRHRAQMIRRYSDGRSVRAIQEAVARAEKV